MAVLYTGLKALNTTQASEVKQIAEEYCDKITTRFPGHTVRLVLKEMDKKVDKAKYLFSAHVEGPGKSLKGHGEDFDLHKSVHQAFNGIKIQIEKKKG